MKRIILSIIILLTVTSEIYPQPFPKKKYWVGCGFIFSDPQREVRFGKYHKSGYEGNLYFRTVLKENLELGVAAEFGFYTFDPQKFRKDKDIEETYLMEYYVDKGTMFSIYQDIYMNALPKYKKDLFFSVGVGFYRLVNKEMRWRLNPFGDEWMVWNTDQKTADNSFGFNLGINYDQKIIFNRLNIVYEVRFHQLIFSQDLQQFLKFKIGFMF